MELIGDIWNAAIITPMINSLVLLYSVFFSNFGLSIVIFTVIVRAILIPLTVKQSRQMKAMSALQPKLKELQERYKNDRQRISQETMRMYREHGVNPLGCLGPMFIQFPIWIGLYQALQKTLYSTPETFVGGLAALAPERREDLARLSWRAFWAATLATLLTGAVAGVFYHGQESLLR